MIKANELRIGNYVRATPMYEHLFTNGIVKIECLSKDIIQNEKYSTLTYKQIEPIEITEEILQQLGFIKTDFTYDKNLLSICLPGYSYENGRTYFNSWCIIEYAPRYVHELQNLFYAITKTELEVAW